MQKTMIVSGRAEIDGAIEWIRQTLPYTASTRSARSMQASRSRMIIWRRAEFRILLINGIMCALSLRRRARVSEGRKVYAP